MKTFEAILEEQKNSLDFVRVKLVTEKKFLLEEELQTPERIADVFWQMFSELDREVFTVLNMTTKNRPMNMQIVSMGTLNGTMVSPREVFKSSVLSNAASIICIHNHPSGDVHPSKEDLEVTYRLQTAGSVLDIEVLDHIIMGSGDMKQFYSMRREGNLLDSMGLNKRIAETMFTDISKEQKEKTEEKVTENKSPKTGRKNKSR